MKMIKSVLAITETRLSELEGAPNLSHHDRNTLQDIVDIQIPFEEATDFVQYHYIYNLHNISFFIGHHDGNVFNFVVIT